MAETKGNIKEGNIKEGQAVESVTEEVPHEADASSAPGPYADLPLNRPPVSTNQGDVPIAHSLIAGAGEGNVGQDGLNPEFQTPAPATKAEIKEVQKDEKKEEDKK